MLQRDRTINAKRQYIEIPGHITRICFLIDIAVPASFNVALEFLKIYQNTKILDKILHEFGLERH